MNYYSTNKKSPNVSLQEAVVKGLAPDRGLYMPKRIVRLPENFFEEIGKSENFIGVNEIPQKRLDKGVKPNLQEIAKTVACAFFGEDIPKEKLDAIVSNTLNFEIPLKKVEEGIYVLELFHGPTFAFKDVGARFMARMLSHFIGQGQKEVNVLVATSGDTGSAVANGFLGVEGIKVFVLYPSGKVSETQEAQFTTLGQNIVALEVDGTFDDCQALVKSAFMDEDLNVRLKLTSANSINVARFLPQSFYYFWAFAQLMGKTKEKGNESQNPDSVYAQQMNQTNARKIVVSVPSGNLGNLTAGLFAKRMGLPIDRFIAANNRNDVFREYLQTGKYSPRASVQTVANAMDVGAPSNFDRILDLYEHSHEAITRDVSAFKYEDNQIREAIKNVYTQSGYLLDPHGACAYLSLKEGKTPEETGIFFVTAHPAKFGETVGECIGKPVQVPDALAASMQNKKQSIRIPNDFNLFKKMLIGGT